jgi:ABC-type Fe3+-hydroxamate transport system substrate-binding protein
MPASGSPTSDVDDLGTRVELPHRISRVVSLVPSLTEAIAATAAEVLVGATDWCTHPADLTVARIGGTKNPDRDAVLRLRPDVVIANDEENRAPDIAALRSAGVPVWVTAPQTLDQGLESLGRMLSALRLGRPRWLDDAAAAWRQPFSVLSRGPRRAAVVPIWRRPWMALGRDTFAGDVLRRLGVDNILADTPERYPRIDFASLPAYDLVVLPDEPYPFSCEDGPEAFTGRAVSLVSGRHLSWYGPSLAEARGVLSQQLAERTTG